MTDTFLKSFFLGGVLVEPQKATITLHGESVPLQPKQMSVLVYLAQNAGRLVSNDELVAECWPGQFISDSPVSKTIAQLRKALQDSVKDCRYIKTVSRKGYMVVAEVKGLSTSAPVEVVSWNEGCPYPGLSAYTEMYEAVYFGREHFAEQQLGWLFSLQGGGWFNLYGPSNSGKSSLLNARFLPAIKRHVTAKNQQDCTVHEIDCTDIAKADAELTAIASANVNRQAPAIIFIDNVENVVDSTLHVSLIHSLLTLIKLQGSIVLSCTDILNQTQLTSVLNHTLGHEKAHVDIRHVAIPSVDNTELYQIIEKSSRAAGLQIDNCGKRQKSLSALIVEGCKQSNNALLITQSTLEQLYSNRSESMLTCQAFEDMGGIAGCWSRIADQAIKSLSKDALQYLDPLLFHLIGTESYISPKPKLKQVEFQSLSKDMQNLARQLLKSGLLSCSATEPVKLSLSSPDLLQCWPNAVKWFEVYSPILYIRQDLSVATQRWLAHERNPDFLFTSKRPLQQALQLDSLKEIPLSTDEKVFLQQSQNRANRMRAQRTGLWATLSASVIALVFLTLSLQWKNTEISQSRNNAQQLISFILSDLKGKLEPLGQLDLLHIVGSQTVDYFNEAGIDNLSGKSLVQLADALNILGEVAVKKNTFVDARKYFEQSLHAISYITETSPHYSLSLEKAIYANFWLGYMDYEQENFDRATNYFSDYRDMADRLLHINGTNTNWMLEKSYALNNLGSIALKQGKLDAAESYFTESKKIKTDLIDLAPDNLVYRDEYTDTLSWLASVAEAKGHYEEALTIYKESLAMMIVVARQAPDNYGLMSNLVIIELRLSQALFDSGNREQALRHLTSAILRLDVLVKHDPENAITKRRLIYAQVLTTRIHRLEGNYDQALLVLQQAINQQSILKASDSHASLIVEKEIDILTEHGQILLAMGQIQSGHSLLDQGIALAKTYDLDDINRQRQFAYLLLIKKLYPSDNKLALVDIDNLITLAYEDMLRWSTSNTHKRSGTILEWALGRLIGKLPNAESLLSNPVYANIYPELTMRWKDEDIH
ncbi:winged helix-turn-helix domain-containing protein [Paraneptunicella aestuarii]|uniref:nSTAND1 domain-containing NTPase n=1 Tax=Paraneptunicella aestuarii TaxID=2831148 RepID=UPI001E3FB134|nr:winged helix-turn-helix domain-containing protein [Paraneptunicella aestuarii]UAA39929.1 winged helix-turn-helix domain-containing protein [Paraneptunicella aestuarii]